MYNIFLAKLTTTTTMSHTRARSGTRPPRRGFTDAPLRNLRELESLLLLLRRPGLFRLVPTAMVENSGRFSRVFHSVSPAYSHMRVPSAAVVCRERFAMSVARSYLYIQYYYIKSIRYVLYYNIDCAGGRHSKLRTHGLI